MLDLTIVIQAGGQSTRMGIDKGLVQFGEVTLVEYIIQQVGNLGFPVSVISNQPEDYSFLGLPVYVDAIPGIGALGGIYSGLHFSRSDYVLMLGCDMPFIEIKLVEYLLDQALGADVVIPVATEKGGMEPFRAIYSKTCEPAIESAISAGKRRAISFFSEVKVLEVGLNVIEQIDPELRSFINLNTPEEYECALTML